MKNDILIVNYVSIKVQQDSIQWTWDSEIDTKIMCGKSKIGQKTTKTEKCHISYTQHEATRSSVSNVSKPDILDDTCIFCRKVKYVPRTNTR